MTHDFVLPPLTGEERARYYTESHRFGALFGIPPATLPADWREFATYAEMTRESDVLTVSTAAREIAGQIFSGPGISYARRNGIGPSLRRCCRRGCGRHLA